MSPNQLPVSQRASTDGGKIYLLDFLIVLARRKKMIAGVTLAAALLAAGISQRLPNMYTATAMFLPPQQNQSSANALLNQFGGMVGMAGIRPNLKNPDDLYIAILKSRNVTEKVVRRFDLQKVYGTDTLADAIQMLHGRITVVSGKDGTISVGVEDRDAKLAADLSNAAIDELDKTMRTFSLTDATFRRGFFDSQMREAKDKLTDAELRLEQTRNTSMSYVDAMRNMKYQESVYEVLLKQFEMAKLDEAKNYPVIQVIDKAEIPQAKSRPKRVLIVLTAVVLGLAFSMSLALLMEKLEHGREDPLQRERLERLKKNLSLR